MVVRLLLEMVGVDLALLFFDFTNNIKLGAGVECISRSSQELHKVHRYVSTSEIHSLSSVCN